MTTPLSSDDLAKRIDSLEKIVADKVRQGEEMTAVVMVLLSRLGDVTRVTVKEAAAIEERLYGHGSVKTVRSKIDAKIYTLEKRNGEKEGRIPIDQIYSGYLPIDVWRKALEKQKGR
ncbi:MAG TPA: hypothetical protein VGR95_12510 [Thermoanaerobaculia bacterium]|jgi:hypothetical protein|nr:hypothetical protein [Thermoanaerobaculia bacterium]